MSILILSGILAFFLAPFLLAGFRRAWRAASVVLLVLASYTIFAWTRPAPAYLDEQDRFGAAAWQMILLTLLAGAALAFATGYIASAVRSLTRKLAPTDFLATPGMGEKRKLKNPSE